MVRLAVALALCVAGSAAMASPNVRPEAVCHRGLRHVSLLSPAQMCPQPLATTIIARPHRGVLHT